MNFNETCVLLVLAVCCFVANVLHGLTGCGSILVLHALWQTAITLAPDILHGTQAFGNDSVKGIAEFSYVLTFFIQVVLTGLLFYDVRRKRAQQLEQGVPPDPSELNGVLLFAFITWSFIGATVGVYTMPLIHENGSRVILGGSSLFFALTFLSLYQMKYLERKKTEDVIRDDLMLMRIHSGVQRRVILQYMKDQKRRKKHKERRRRHRAQRRLAKKAEKMRRQELFTKALMANSNDSMMPAPELEGAPLEPHCAPPSPNPAHRRGSATSDSAMSSRTNRTLEVHGASHLTSPDAHFVSDVHLPKSVASKDEYHRAHYPSSSGRRSYHRQRVWIKEIDVQTYIRQRLSEISRNVDSPSEEIAHEAQLAAWTLRAMEGHEKYLDSISPCMDSSADDEQNNSSQSNTITGDISSTEDDDTTDATAYSDTTRCTSPTAERAPPPVGPGSEAKDTCSPQACTARFDGDAKAAAERKEQHKKWQACLGKAMQDDAGESIDLTKSIAMAAATAPRRVIMGHTEVLNIGLREVQQQQLKTLQELSSNKYARSRQRHRLVYFMRMDGGVVMSASVSSFFSGFLGSYTGVADPPLIIFALAMNISIPELRINYAVSSIVPAAMRAVVGITNDFANKSLLVYYIVSVLFAWGGVAFGLYISHRHTVTHPTFMASTLAILFLVAFLMLVPISEAFLRLVATAACFIIVTLAIFRQQRMPEHHRPPAPPNTPATAAEVEAFEQYWRQHGRQKTFDDYANSGSAFFKRSHSSAVLLDDAQSESSAHTAGASASVSPASDTPLYRLQRGLEPSQARRTAPQSEDIPIRWRAAEAEELITIVPVNATSRT
ncbi:hypothetical protein ABL78_5931 [Leptomonas seymouri]|uniref:Uncharacterized protein n=1 Tax=Leptomonas seymouri TaxID=5684 RepID=A0A0N1PAY0_LEPSE|nr:hypothetical protein ABL78_5931 [Leptomonas seymouri]|eukprot:KPI85022.1 hypothetical protein ABL78_5931 [Leptomonas seymouri]